MIRVRAERFGASVSIDEPPAIVAVDRTMAAQLGVDGRALWEGDDPGLDVDALSAPNEVHVAATDRCPVGCARCYADARADGHEPRFDEIVRRLETLAAAGVFRIAFGGGEALLRSDLPELARRACDLGLTPTVTTSGLGLTSERAEELRAFAQVNVSYDGAGEAYQAVRGYDGARMAERAMRALASAGVPFGINVVLTRASWPSLEATVVRAVSFGAREAQLLRFKPSGRGQLDYLAQRLTPVQIESFPETIERLSRESKAMIRIDCALVPFLVADGRVRAADLVRFGVSGCEAARSLAAVRSDGALAPCSFWPESGSIIDEDAWTRDETMRAVRAYGSAPPEPCKSCDYRASCRSGCRIVARYLTGDPFAPDPECPRVRRAAPVTSE
jgi:radical SAM protein with 4Fe4S-binding SPASM domain